ncbi:hypothetical protein LINPERPRIM_LOCUS36667 [Linum perenne]
MNCLLEVMQCSLQMRLRGCRPAWAYQMALVLRGSKWIHTVSLVMWITMQSWRTYSTKGLICMPPV